jgi:hypothetical protein
VRNLIVGMGAQLKRVHITRVEKSTYYAELQIQRGETLSTSTRAPRQHRHRPAARRADLRADDLLVEPAEDDDDEVARRPASVESPTSRCRPTRSVGALRRSAQGYLENLRPEDFGKFNP